MNRPYAFRCWFRGSRKMLVVSVVMLTILAAVVFLVLSMVGGPKLYVRRGGMKMFEYDVNVYGICPECRKAIEATLYQRRRGDYLWDGRIWYEGDRASSTGRHHSGFGYFFECPVCDARLRANVEHRGRRTWKHPFGEETRVWGLDSDFDKEPAGEPLHVMTNAHGKGQENDEPRRGGT